MPSRRANWSPGINRVLGATTTVATPLSVATTMACSSAGLPGRSASMVAPVAAVRRTSTASESYGTESGPVASDAVRVAGDRHAASHVG